jgi:adenylate kinase family enzyme
LIARPWPSILLIGPTGSGKTPLGDEIERRGLDGRRCVHFDFGANLRAVAADLGSWDMLTAEELGSVRTSLATGALFEDKDMPMIVKVLCRFAERRGLTAGCLLILNGLPRHRRQAESLAGVVAVERVIQLEASAAVIRKRMRLDPGGDRGARIDDSLDAVERRLADFRQRTLPLIDFYHGLGVTIVAIPVTANMTAGEMFEDVAREMRDGGGG